MTTELTEAERDALRESVHDLPPDDGPPWLFATVERILADRLAAAWDEGFDEGSDDTFGRRLSNPYRATH